MLSWTGGILQNASDIVLSGPDTPSWLSEICSNAGTSGIEDCASTCEGTVYLILFPRRSLRSWGTRNLTPVVFLWSFGTFLGHCDDIPLYCMKSHLIVTHKINCFDYIDFSWLKKKKRCENSVHLLQLRKTLASKRPICTKWPKCWPDLRWDGQLRMILLHG